MLLPLPHAASVLLIVDRHGMSSGQEGTTNEGPRHGREI